ncbi:hypothetical protein Pint_17605 [Pistacia integerrima]|uniref:Uncharacterized protein n=1 Tax=Pistacia integerrima TaxID=434235 RepID=A0ACC0YU53_9ROSI|nr:hypothetical protein Pint_17605 [Pistacia integerrima]
MILLLAQFFLVLMKQAFLAWGQMERQASSFPVSIVVIEWSLQNQGQVLWSRNCRRYFDYLVPHFL